VEIKSPSGDRFLIKTPRTYDHPMLFHWNSKHFTWTRRIIYCPGPRESVDQAGAIIAAIFAGRQLQNISCGHTVSSKTNYP
jgi:hypothetical protein